MKSIRALDVLAGPIRRRNGTTIELPVGQNVYALSQQYGDGIWYRAKILKSRLVRGDRAYFLHFHGYTRCDDEWIDELDIIPVHEIDLGERVYACWMGDDEMQGYWFPGTIQSYRKVETGAKNLKGSRLFHVKFDDGDEDKKIHEIYVMPYNVYSSLIASGERDTRKRKTTSGRSKIKLEKSNVELPTNLPDSDFAAYSCSVMDEKPSCSGSEVVIDGIRAEYKEYLSNTEEAITGGQRKRKRRGSLRECNQALLGNKHESNFVVCST